MIVKKHRAKALAAVGAALVIATGCGGFLGIDDDDDEGPPPTTIPNGDAQTEGSISAEGGELVDAGNGDACDSACCAELSNDPKNCGACGRDCIDVACVSGVCQATDIATTPSLAPVTHLLAHDESLAFIVGSGAGVSTGLYDMTKTGDAGPGSAPTIASGACTSLTWDPSSKALFYVTQSGNSGTLWRHPMSDDGGTPFVNTTFNLTVPLDLAFFNGQVLVATNTPTCVVTHIDPLLGGNGSPEQPRDAPCTDIESDDPFLFVSTYGGNIGQVIRSSTIPPMSTVPFGVEHPTSLAVNGDNAYIITDDRAISKLEGSGLIKTILTNRTGLKRIVFRGNALYFLDATGIFKADLDALGPPTPITRDPATAFDVDATHVYYAALGKIRRTPR